MSKINVMDEAVELAKNGVEGNHGGPFGAIICCGDDIVGRGFNRVLSENDPTAHAEVNAIREACKTLEKVDLSDCDLYTTCEPCPMCLSAAYWARIKNIYYTSTRKDAAELGFDDAVIYDELALPFNQRKLPLVQIDCDSVESLYQIWSNKPDKKIY